MLSSLELQQIGLEPSDVSSIVLLHQRHGHALYRLISGQRSLILKQFADAEQAIEVRNYSLLTELGVPTLPVYASSSRALLLEDLETSATWRLAAPDDMSRPETGTAVAEWYHKLHSAGRNWKTDLRNRTTYLTYEVDALDASRILLTGERLQLADNPVWHLAATHIEALKLAVYALPTTLTYNDFHWTNLALSRQDSPTFQAIAFDYHLLGLGPVYSDYRNARGAFSDEGRAAFEVAFGDIDTRGAVLDAPLATLYALSVATEWPQLPVWAQPLVQDVVTGELEINLRNALSLH